MFQRTDQPGDVSAGGAAPLSLDVLEFFAAMGLPIKRAVGDVRARVSGHLQPRRPDQARHRRPGDPGHRAAPGRGRRAAAAAARWSCAATAASRSKTAEAIDAEGWLHTGDIASIDDDGYVTIVDRKKEMIINAAGKNMSPANIEGALKGASMLIGQAFVVGDRRPYNVALLVLDPDASAAYATAHGLPDASPAALAVMPACRRRWPRPWSWPTAGSPGSEQVKRFTILPVDWLPAGDELTPTMKLKRRPIAHKYAAEIEALYAQQAAAMG